MERQREQSVARGAEEEAAEGEAVVSVRAEEEPRLQEVWWQLQQVRDVSPSACILLLLNVRFTAWLADVDPGVGRGRGTGRRGLGGRGRAVRGHGRGTLSLSLSLYILYFMWRVIVHMRGYL
jgi:hypothetical protein